MSDVVYRSEVRIERVKGPVRRAYFPAEQEPVIFGVHGAVAEHYEVPEVAVVEGVDEGECWDLPQEWKQTPSIRSRKPS